MPYGTVPGVARRSGAAWRGRLWGRHAWAVTLSADDRLAIHELMARYANLIDSREFSRAGEVFADDARYDVSDFDMGVAVGAAAIAELLRGSQAHPLAHHVTNVEISTDRDGPVRVRSKVLGVGAGGRVGSADYRDTVVKAPQGWRIAERIVTLRTPDRIPPPS